MARIVLIHGFNVRDAGARTVDQLASYLRRRGHSVDTDSADYGYYSLLMVRLFSVNAVERIRNAILDADVVITHSNGANFATKALKKISDKKLVFHLSPALNKRARPPASVFEQHVFHTRHDGAVKAAMYLLFHPWGNMGAVGYQGKDGRVYNHDYTNRVNAHSDWFRGINRAYFAGVIDALIKGST